MKKELCESVNRELPTFSPDREISRPKNENNIRMLSPSAEFILIAARGWRILGKSKRRGNVIHVLANLSFLKELEGQR